MHALKLVYLIGLLHLVRCQSLMELSGNGQFSMPTDDEDDTFPIEPSGSGDDDRNSTVSVPATVVVMSTSAERTTAKLITTPKVIRVTSKVKISSKQQTTFNQRTVNEDEDYVTKQGSKLDLEDDQSMSTAVTTTSENLDLLELLWKQPGIVAGLIGGAILGVLFAILLTLFIIYRMRRRSDRAFRKGTSRGSQDDTGTFWFDDDEAGTIAVSRTSAERYPRSTDAYVNPQATSDTLKSSQAISPSTGAQGQSGLYATLVAPSGQTAYDEYLSNLYNQQVYNGYLQKA